MGILATYKAYRKYEPVFNDWQEQRGIEDSKKEALIKNGITPKNNHPDSTQKKAQTVARSMILLDNYAQTKAEDVETVFQTIQAELLVGLTAATAVPALLPGLEGQLKKINKKNKLIEKTIEFLKNYKQANVKVGKFNIPAVKFVTGVVGAISSVIFAYMVKDAVCNQLGATRRAKFEAMNKELSNIQDFAILTDDQEKKVQEIKNSTKDPDLPKKHPQLSAALDDAIERINIAESINSVNVLMKDKNTYIEQKNQYDASLKKNETNFDNPLTQQGIKDAEEDKELFQNIIKKVDIDSQDELEKIEKLVNVGYSATIGSSIVETLLKDDIVKIMKVKNPLLKTVLGFGIPLVTYMVFNKNLANFQNNAIKAIRYKKITELVNNKDNFNNYSNEQIASVAVSPEVKKKEKNENIFKFLKGISSDIKDYKSFQKNELKEMKKYLNAKRQLELPPSQLNDAKELQRNAFMTINKVDDNNQKYSESIETISELALAPVEIAAPIVGNYIGKTLGSNFKSLGTKRLFRGLGLAAGFLPGALTEIITTAMQRNALRISGMLSADELNDYRKFVNYDNKSFRQLVESSFAFNARRDMASPFITFQSQLKKD